MRAIQVDHFGGPEALVSVELPDPIAGPGQAIVDVAAADVLFLDAVIRYGLAADFFPLRPPYVPGTGVAGTVISVGSPGRNLRYTSSSAGVFGISSTDFGVAMARASGKCRCRTLSPP